MNKQIYDLLGKYDEAGYDRDGFDREGFNKFGYDRDCLPERVITERGPHASRNLHHPRINQ